jgi:Fe-S-cluster-containing dehydrogenase component
MTKRTLAIGEDFCWGCRTCEVACKQEHRAPDGVRLIRVLEDGPREVDGRLDFRYRVAVCRHCEDPPCAAACPAEAITVRPDAIVVLEDAACTGCEACRPACPYEAIAFDEARGRAIKCNLCHHRVDQGLVPACADNVCPGHCMRFGSPEEIRAQPMGLRAQRPRARP